MPNLDASNLLVLQGQLAATLTTPDQNNLEFRGIQLGVNIISGGSVVVTVQGKDPGITVNGTVGAYYTILASTSLSGVGFTNMTVYPGITNSNNLAQSAPLPRTWRIQAVVTGGPITATVSASLIM